MRFRALNIISDCFEALLGFTTPLNGAVMVQLKKDLIRKIAEKFPDLLEAIAPPVHHFDRNENSIDATGHDETGFRK
jgi:hypothetical protein